jgi:hypothetical protein
MILNLFLSDLLSYFTEKGSSRETNKESDVYDEWFLSAAVKPAA